MSWFCLQLLHRRAMRRSVARLPLRLGTLAQRNALVTACCCCLAVAPPSHAASYCCCLRRECQSELHVASLCLPLFVTWSVIQNSVYALLTAPDLWENRIYGRRTK